MFKKVLLAVFAFSSLAFADASQVYGKWAVTKQDNGFTFTMALDVAPTQTGIAVTCTYQGQSLTAAVSVPSEVTDTQLHIKGAAEDKKSANGLDCSAQVVPMTFDYQVAGNVLVLTYQGETVAFTRVP